MQPFDWEDTKRKVYGKSFH